MLDLDQIQTILEIHGKGLQSDKGEIRTILISAGYQETEIEEVLLLAQGGPDIKTSRNDGLYKLFRADTTLRPAEISALLGITVRVTTPPVQIKEVPKSSYRELIAICVMTILLAFVGLTFAMYIAEIGPFHKAAATAFAK